MIDVNERRKLTFGVIFERASIASFGLIMWWAGTKINNLAESVQKLAEIVSILNERSSSERQRTDRLEQRIGKLEEKIILRDSR